MRALLVEGREAITQPVADWSPTQSIDDETRRRIVALGAAVLILAAAIAFVTLRPGPETASTVDAVDARVDDPAGSSEEQAGAAVEPSAAQQDSAEQGSTDAGSATADATSQPGTTDSAPETAPSETQAAAIPRTIVSSPEIVGIVNGRITFISDGAPAPDVLVALIASDETGTVGDTLQELATDADGRYGFDVDDGCYIAEFTAPAGFAFPGVGEMLTGPSVCVTADSPFTVGASLEAAG